MRIVSLSIGAVALGSLLPVACGGDQATPATQGDLDGPCFSNGTCNAGLVCDIIKGTAKCAPGGDASAGDASSTPEDASADAATDAPGADASTFDPGQLIGLSVWLRADKGVVSDGSGVSTWSDQSGNSNDFTPLAANHPPLVPAAYNGLPAVDVRTNQLTGHATTIGTGAFTLEMVVGNMVSSSQLFMTSVNNSMLAVGVQNDGTVAVQFTQIGPNLTITGTKVVSGASAHLVGLVRDGSGTVSLRIDGAPDGTPAANGVGDLGDLPGVLGGGEVTETIVVVGTLTALQTTALENYLKTKYGL